jgi:hypothetical protein
MSGAPYGPFPDPGPGVPDPNEPVSKPATPVTPKQRPYRQPTSPNINPAPLSVLPNNVPGLQPPSFKKGGKVKKTGVYKLHAGERVLNKKQAAGGKVNKLKVKAEDLKKGYRKSDALKDL